MQAATAQVADDTAGACGGSVLERGSCYAREHNPRGELKMISSRVSRSRHVAIIGFLGALLGFVGAAAADDLDVCHDASGDVAISACTRAIESGHLSKHNLAVAYTNRGGEGRGEGGGGRAIYQHNRG